MKRFYAPRSWTLAEKLAHFTDRSGGPDACWLWTGSTNTFGYGITQWAGRLQRAHRLAWQEESGSIPAEKFVLHRCDNPPCVNPRHLWLGSKRENSADMVAKGRCKSRGPGGERHGTAKLTEADVWAIRQAEGTHRAIAAQYGVGRTQVSSIKQGKSWKHLQPEMVR